MVESLGFFWYFIIVDLYIIKKFWRGIIDRCLWNQTVQTSLKSKQINKQTKTALSGSKKLTVKHGIFQELNFLNINKNKRYYGIRNRKFPPTPEKA